MKKCELMSPRQSQDIYSTVAAHRNWCRGQKQSLCQGKTKSNGNPKDKQKFKTKPQ